MKFNRGDTVVYIQRRVMVKMKVLDANAWSRSYILEAISHPDSRAIGSLYKLDRKFTDKHFRLLKPSKDAT